MNRRFVIQDSKGTFIAAVYAERLEVLGSQGNNSFNGNQTGHFYRGEEIIASMEMGPHTIVGDSTGVMVPKELLDLTPNEQREAIDAWRATAGPAIINAPHRRG